MVTDHAELLSAFMDREPVDPDALAAALEDPEARRALVAFARLREALHAPVPGDAEAPAPVAPPAVAKTGRRRWHLAAAAALLAAGVGAGMFAERYTATARPPQPTRIVQLEPIQVTP
jgi:hypothetical protein